VWKSGTFDAKVTRTISRVLIRCCQGVTLMSLVACSKPAAANGLRVGLITPGSIADAAWNSGAYQGLKQIHDSFHLPISHVEARTPAEQDEALRTYAAQGYRLVFAHGFEFQDPAERVSSEYPKTIFIVTSGARAKGNVAPLIFRLEEASYLAGMVAGSLTKSQRLGFVGGIELPPIKAAYQGWVNGAKAVNPKVQTRVVYLNSFDDVSAGREAALALIQSGVDMFHHNADAAALGVFQAAKEHPGVYVFGANADQASLAPGRVIGSAVIDLPRAFLLVAREVQQGTFTPRVEAFGLKSGVIRYVANPSLDSLVPPRVKARVQAAADSIAAGTLIAAPRPPSMQAFLAPTPLLYLPRRHEGHEGPVLHRRLPLHYFVTISRWALLRMSSCPSCLRGEHEQ
jgi:basic membrane protein A and related proteins